MELKDKLKKLRIKNNLTMKELADKFNEKFNTNISKSMISNWENGTFKPSLNNLSLYSQHFSISLDFFQEDKQTKEYANELSKEYVRELPKEYFDDMLIGLNDLHERTDRKTLTRQINENLAKTNITGLKKIKNYSDDILLIKPYKED